jgi:hypothetical protein
VVDVAIEQDHVTSEAQPENKAQGALGQEFPGFGSKSGTKWRAWVMKRLQEQEGQKRDARTHYTRHRRFKDGDQWLSVRDGTVRTVDSDENQVRMVMNEIGPALDFRLNLVTEQRPGFRAHALGQGVEGRETAEAQQNVAEYYYNKLHLLKVTRDALSNALTDGVAFVHVFVDPNAGPRTQDVEKIAPTDPRFDALKAVGYEEDEEGFVLIPLDEAGDELEPGSDVREISEGDIGVRVLRADEVYADPEAKTVNGPYDRAQWMIVRRWRDLEAAKFETGNRNLKPDNAASSAAIDQELDGLFGGGDRFKGGLPPFPRSSKRNRESVWHYLIYFMPNRDLGIEDGAWVELMGDTFIDSARALPGRKIPLARYTDGSSDPQLMPRPVVAGWLGKQTTINALVSKLVAHVRVLGGGRVIAQRGTVLRETFMTAIGSLLEYSGTKPDFQGGSAVSGDVWRTLFEIVKKLEDETGWNDLARGQVGGASGGGGSGFNDVSGRALLGAKELFERTFGPVVQATAEGGSELAVLLVDYARFLFDTPRLIPVAGRPDLAKRIKAETLGEESVVYMDPETLMPLPRSLRNQMLVDMFDKGLIGPEELRKRSPFADIRNLHMGDVDHWERAQFLNSLLEERWEQYAKMERVERFSPGPGLPVLWLDLPAVHKAALLEIALDERKAFALRELAVDRWGVYDQLERFQAGAAAFPPVEALGLPPDVQLMLETQAQEQVAGGGAPTPGGDGVQAPQGPVPALSPVPQQSAGGAPALGQHGDVERQAVELSQGR